LIAVAAYGLYQVKYVVRDVKYEVAQLSQELQAEQERLHVLKTEWAYLTRPDRLRSLSENHLQLVPVSGSHMQEMYVLPVRGEPLIPEATDAPMAQEASYGG
jgi:hypothetical protein